MRTVRETARHLGLAAAVSLLGCHAPTPEAPLAESTSRPASAPVALNPELEASFVRWEQDGPSGDPQHRERLQKLAAVVRQRLVESGQVELVFVCTHNSRRSHIAQLLGLAAARRRGLAGVRTFSGGTEATAFNPRAIAALRRVGFTITGGGEEKNPRYTVKPGAALTVEAFSKRFTDPPNPSSGFVAVMTCAQADAACPVVQGAASRLAVPYDDPKVADGTPEEARRYDERVAQIGRDLAWVFASVAGG